MLTISIGQKRRQSFEAYFRSPVVFVDRPHRNPRERDAHRCSRCSPPPRVPYDLAFRWRGLAFRWRGLALSSLLAAVAAAGDDQGSQPLSRDFMARLFFGRFARQCFSYPPSGRSMIFTRAWAQPAACDGRGVRACRVRKMTPVIDWRIEASGQLVDAGALSGRQRRQ
jgi:hypothetical protein